VTAPLVEVSRDDEAWARVLRVAGVTSLLGAAVAGTLHRFVGVGTGALVLVAGATALMVGCRLPAARPSWLRPHER
jgi:hypothetical protein